MTVGELITELEKYDKDLTVMAAGEDAQKVILETCQDHSYVRILDPWDIEFSGLFEGVEE